MIATIQSKKFSKSGSAMFGIDGQHYFASRNINLQGLEPGVSIEFEWEEFGEDRGRGRPRTITRWKPAQTGYSGGSPQSTSNAGNPPQSRSNGASQPVGPQPDALILPFISNTIAHAIQAGLIKAPADLTQWVLSARSALNARPPQSEPKSATEPEFDDQIPF